MQAMVELQTVVADSKSTSEQIEEKLKVVRIARQKAKADLAAAQKNLMPLLTLDQEAVLVALGYFD